MAVLRLSFHADRNRHIEDCVDACVIEAPARGAGQWIKVLVCGRGHGGGAERYCEVY